MKKVTLWSIVVILALLLYIVLVLLFRTLFQDITERRQVARTPAPTFTLPPAPPAVVLATSTPDAPTPSPTSSPTSTPAATPTEAPTEAPTLTPPPAQPQAVASITVNVRSGPGVNYPVVATLPPNVPVVIVGQNAAGTWWQIEGPDGSRGWVAASVVQASANVDVPIAQAPAPPAPPAQPSPTPAPPAPEPQPAHQYEPTGWFDDTNYGLTRFLGTITDADGNPVNGVFVEAQCGDYRVISNPSGPVGWGPFNESHDWPPGFYDITLDTKPIACHWFLSVVETPDKETVSARLSEIVEVETTFDKSIITANWRKNW
jgi:hypothetical protein